MKSKLALKTVLLTLAVIFILAISAFGIASLFAPKVMMDYTAKHGLKSISADYAFREYERSGDLSCLARSFIVSADVGLNQTADRRFTILYEDEGFADFCKLQDETLTPAEGISYSYRGYVCGRAAVVRYRLASTEEDRTALLEFVELETEKRFPQGNPSIQLAAALARSGDSALCLRLLEALRAGDFEENADYLAIVKILEEHT